MTLQEILAQPELNQKLLNEPKTTGFVTAMACSPNVLAPEAWVPYLWGGDEVAPFSDGEQLENYLEQIIAMWNHFRPALLSNTWVVTSSIALEIVEHLDSHDHKIIWGPDRHLGSYIANQTGADMLLWNGECVVHDEFSADALRKMKAVYPDAAILVHPESPASVVALADAVGSTSQLIKAAKSLPQQQMIVATDKGIFYKMQQLVPEKTLIEAPTAGAGATCRSCAHCPWMAMNGLQAIEQALVEGGKQHEIFVDESVRVKSLIPLNRMLDFAEQLNG